MTAPAGIRDVAALAGVSPGTVSKALNGTGQLREATRERVRAAARQLAFEPNPVARSLLRGRTCTVGIVTTDHSGRFSIPLMRGAEDALAAGELAALMCDSRGDPVRERDYVRLLLARRVDGIIVAGRRTDPRPRCAPRALPRRCRRAGELLLAAIAGRPCAGVHELPCRLVIRESSAPAGANVTHIEAASPTEIVVDNSAGGDAAFAAEVCRALRARGFTVELRKPSRKAMFDTAVHLVTAGLAIRVPSRPDRATLDAIEQDVRAALLHRPSQRRRTRSVPVHLGDTPRVLEWIDVFD